VIVGAATALAIGITANRLPRLLLRWLEDLPCSSGIAVRPYRRKCCRLIPALTGGGKVLCFPTYVFESETGERRPVAEAIRLGHDTGGNRLRLRPHAHDIKSPKFGFKTANCGTIESGWIVETWVDCTF
jgi:hypothetical protein